MADNNSIPTFAEYEAKNGKLLNFEEFRKLHNMSRELVHELIEQGCFGDNLLRVGKDVQSRPLAYTAKYYFNADWAFNLKREDIGYTLKDIAEILDIPYSWLRDVSAKGYLDEGRLSRKLWNLEWFKGNLNKVRLESNNQKGKWRQSEFYDLLSKNQQQWIEKYLDRRKKGHGIRVGRKVEWTKPPAKLERTIEQWRKDLSIFFYKIICGRVGIPDYHLLERLGKYRPLTLEERTLFIEQRDCFKIIDFTPSDVDHIALGYKDTTFTRAVVEKHLTPFLYFVLNTLKEEWVGKKQQKLLGGTDCKITDDEVSLAKELYETFEMSIELSLSKVPKFAQNDEEDTRPAVYLTHEQILLAKNIIRSEKSFQEPVKRTLIFAFGSFVGIRPDEFANLRLENFVLDKDTKLLKRFVFDYSKKELVEVLPDNPSYSKGYGRLFITYNKGGYSPSHKEHGTLLVPKLTSLINSYLEEILYPKLPDAKGRGYFLRPNLKLSEVPYNARGVVQWLSSYSTENFTFLSAEERIYFKYYDVRHTVYNLIIKTPVDGISFEVRERAAQIHARHDIKKKAGNTGRKSYTEDISLEEYFTVIDQVLNFPWSLDEKFEDNFYTWAEQRNIIESRIPKSSTEESPEESISKAIELTQVKDSLLSELTKQLNVTEELANKLANGPSGDYKDVKKWTAKTIELDKEIKRLKREIKSVTSSREQTA